MEQPPPRGVSGLNKGDAAMPFIIIGILVVVAIVILYFLRTFRLEKVEIEVPATPELLEKEAGDLAEMAGILDTSGTQEKPKEQEPYAELHGPPQTDPLCDLKTGAAHAMDCQRALSQAMGTWAVVWFDLDRFRFVNSIKGMSIGDYVLTNLAQGMQGVFPEDSLYTRISADHFSVTFPLADGSLLEEYGAELKRVCEKIRNDIAVKTSMRVCMGVCVTGVGDFADDYDVMLAKANIARHCLKSSKSDIFAMYDQSMVASYLFGESALDDFGDNQYDEEIVPYFTPISDIVRNRIVSAQAMMRWGFEEMAHKDRPIDPGRARLPSNGRKLVYHVCRAVSRWRKSGKEVLATFVPLPPTELFRKDIDEFILRCTQEFQLQTHEIIPVADIAAFLIENGIARIQVKKLIDIGCKVAVEGNCCTDIRLDALAESGVSYVKLPAAVTAGIAKNPERLERLSGLDRKIKAMGMQPVFEGVNENAQMRAIQGFGGVLVEGRYAGRAVSGDDFAQVLTEYIHKQRIISSDTVILDDETTRSGDFNI